MKNGRIWMLGVMLMVCMSASAIKVVFRLDDPTVMYDSVHNRVLQLFAKNEVPLSVAVIPCDTNEIPYAANDSNYMALLQAPNIEICLHGLKHEDCDNTGEFSNLTPQETKRRIQKGAEMLRKQFAKPIITFVAPYNNVNTSVPEALWDNGFKILSTEISNQAFGQLPKGGNIQYYPETLGALMEEKGIWNAAREVIGKNEKAEGICVIMFHAYDVADEASWAQLEDLLDYCQASEHVELYTFSSLYESGEQAKWIRYKANLYQNGLKKLVLSKGVLYPTYVCYMVHVINAMLYVCIVLIGFCFMLRRYRKQDTRKYVKMAMIVIVTIMFLIAWNHWLSPLKLLVVAILLGIIPLVYSVRCKV